MKAVFTYTICLLFCLTLSAQVKGKYSAIYSGSPWFDDRGGEVSAHGACIVQDGGQYYLFGEKHKDKDNAFYGFTCYSSKDLYNWKYEGVALNVQESGKLGSSRVGERVKVMHCPSTKEYVMYMHVDSLDYKDQFVGYATSQNITGPYEFKGPLLYNGAPIKKWDMGTYKDKDGSGYVLLHGGDIYKLANDYKSVIAHTNTAFEKEFESPAIFKKGELYYFLGSHLTSWERNDNYYYTATSLAGPWTHRGIFAPENSLTWNSQTTFVLPVEGSAQTTYMYMGDRWAYPNHASSASYVWQPLTVEGTKLSIPQFYDAWQIDVKTGLYNQVNMGKVIENTDNQIVYEGNWNAVTQDGITVSKSDSKSDLFSYTFTGTQVAFYNLSGPDGGHAVVWIKNSKGKTVATALLDLYCKNPVSTLSFISPEMPKDKYCLSIWVKGNRGNWTDKRKNNYGSTGYTVALDKIVVTE